MLLAITTTLLLLSIPLFTLRLLSILPGTRVQKPRRPSRQPREPTHLLIVLGSGGHTAEMLRLLRNLETKKYIHRTYIVSSGDDFSADLARNFEETLFDDCVRADLDDNGWGEATGYGSYEVETVPRARNIHQSALTTPFSSLVCLMRCIGVLWRCGYPGLILSNGPATGVIVIVAALVMKFFGLPGTSGRMKTIYVESWARVRRLSLSGKILLRVVDRFIVQWEALLGATAGKGEYVGVLV